MTALMNDPSLPPTEDDIAEALSTDLSNRTYKVTITMTPKPGVKAPALPEHLQSRVVTFTRMPDAQEFIRLVVEDPKAIGSPKQILAKRATILKCDPKLLPFYDVTCFVESSKPAPKEPHVPRRTDGVPFRRPDSNASADQPPNDGGPAEFDDGGLYSPGDALSERTAGLPETGGETEDDESE